MLPQYRSLRLFSLLSLLLMAGLAPLPASAILDFQNVYVGHQKELVLTYTAHSPRGVGLIVTRVGIVGSDAADFTITRDGMTGGPYADGTRVSVTIRFLPTTPGIKHASFVGDCMGADGSPCSFATTDLTGAALKLSITQLNSRTFVTPDTIMLQANVGAPVSAVAVQWTVEGRDAANGITGFPMNEAHPSDGSGNSTFSFSSANPTLVNDRRRNWTRGSRAANPAISFEVTAKVILDGEEFPVRLSETTLGPLSQDETDRLRQEYYDYNIPVPGRGDVVASLGAGYNEGNYGVQLSVDLPGHYNGAVAAYRGRNVMIDVTIGGRTFTNIPATIPATAPVSISSGYRNPQRNRAVGSLFPDSRHTRGRALDIVPSVVPTRVTLPDGRMVRVNLSLHGTLYPALHDAANTVGTAICEHSSTPVPCGNTTENHVHVQW